MGFRLSNFGGGLPTFSFGNGHGGYGGYGYYGGWGSGFSSLGALFAGSGFGHPAGWAGTASGGHVTGWGNSWNFLNGSTRASFSGLGSLFGDSALPTFGFGGFGNGWGLGAGRGYGSGGTPGLGMYGSGGSRSRYDDYDDRYYSSSQSRDVRWGNVFHKMWDGAEGAGKGFEYSADRVSNRVERQDVLGTLAEVVLAPVRIFKSAFVGEAHDVPRGHNYSPPGNYYAQNSQQRNDQQQQQQSQYHGAPKTRFL